MLSSRTHDSDSKTITDYRILLNDGRTSDCSVLHVILIDKGDKIIPTNDTIFQSSNSVDSGTKSNSLLSNDKSPESLVNCDTKKIFDGHPLSHFGNSSKA